MLRASYIAEFNQKFTGPAAEQVTAFGRTARRDLNWIFSVQTERVVDKDNTVAIADRHWQLEKTRFRSWLAECTVTIHEHLDGLVSIRYGPPVVGRYQADGSPLVATSKPWPDSGSYCPGPKEAEKTKNGKPKGINGSHVLFRTDHVLIKADNLTCYRPVEACLGRNFASLPANLTEKV